MIPILMYHQIGEPAPKGTPYRGLTVHPKRFTQQMRWLKRFGYTGLSMQDLMPYLRGEKHGKVIGITFDDGYQNVLHNALPVLQALGFTSTNYIVSNHISGDNFWDHHKGIPRSALMSEAELHQWLAAGQEIGSHTMDHVHLPEISTEQAQQQIQQSKIDLENRFQAEVTAFCYPYGHYNATIQQWTQDSGYTNATTTARGLALNTDNPFELPRVTVSRSTHLLRFLQKCLTQLEHKKRFAS